MQDKETSPQIYDAVWRYAYTKETKTRVRLLCMALASKYGHSLTAEELAMATAAGVDRTRKSLRKLRSKGVVRSVQVNQDGRLVYGWELDLEQLNAALDSDNT
jgi:transcription initiation factor IIE alpha subunit